MNIEDILTEWEKDKIEPTNIEKTAYEIPKLHHKYISWLSHERFRLKRFEAELRVLNFQKWEFFSQGPNEDTNRKQWQLPPKGMIIKSEIPYYLDADEDLNNMKLKVEYQREKVELLQEIIGQINTRNYIITNIVKYRIFESGS